MLLIHAQHKNMVYPANFIGPIPQGSLSTSDWLKEEQQVKQTQPYGNLLKSPADMGSVLGSSTYSGGGSGGLDALIKEAELKAKQEEEIANQKKQQIYGQIDNVYNPFYSALDQRSSGVNQDQTDLNSIMSSGYNEQKGIIGNAQTTSLADLAQSGQNVLSNKASSLRNISNDLNSAFSAANQKLGSMGSSDSSAANMYGYALGKQATRRGADLGVATGNQLAQIDLKKNEVVRSTQDKLSGLETWKANKTYEIGQYIRQLRQEIAAARSETDSAKAQAKANLAVQGYDRAVQRLQQINDFALNAKAQMLQDARSNISSIQSFADQLKQNSTVATPQYQYDPFTLGQGMNFQTQGQAPIYGTGASDMTAEDKKKAEDLYTLLNSQ